MLEGSKLVAFIATTDSRKARAFYEGLLGLTFVSDDEFAMVLAFDGIQLRVQKVKELTPQSHTVLGWFVTSIEEVTQAISAADLQFERYAFLQQDAGGVWTAPSGALVAWLKDPDGNLISFTQATRYTRK
jgi:catechol 2,3-dioxygenase-like lactoylglutathione lyase family enzyme